VTEEADFIRTSVASRQRKHHMRAKTFRVVRNPLYVLLPLIAVCVMNMGGHLRVAAAGYYIEPSQVDLAEVLPPPPRAGSAQGEADLKAVLDAERHRDKRVIDAALADVDQSVFRFAEVMGPGFNSRNLPFATIFFQRLASDADEVQAAAKVHFDRLRPFVVDREIQTLVPKPSSPSYPSGHATFAYVNAIVLSNMVPEKTDAIFSRASDYAYHRVVEGVHYPSDIEAGMISASVIANVLLHQPGYLTDFARARAEVRNAIGLKQ
jgi:acid phosphatase (class A)